MTSNTQNRPAALQVPPGGLRKQLRATEPLVAGTMPRQKPKGWLHSAVAHFVLIILCLGASLPFLWMVSTSLKTLEAASTGKANFVPHPIE
jgi:ABC-type glycerol-3-phosphate transport system permease component